MSLRDMFMSLVISRVAAPDWFVEEFKRANAIEKELYLSLGITDEDINKVKEEMDHIVKGKVNALTLEDFMKIREMSMKKEKELKEKGKVPSHEAISKAMLGQEMLSAHQTYIWKKFRWEMSGTKFATASRLYYDNKNNFIEIKKL